MTASFQLGMTASFQLGVMLAGFSVTFAFVKLIGASWGTALSFGGFGFTAALLVVLLVLDPG